MFMSTRKAKKLTNEAVNKALENQKKLTDKAIENDLAISLEKQDQAFLDGMMVQVDSLARWNEVSASRDEKAEENWDSGDSRAIRIQVWDVLDSTNKAYAYVDCDVKAVPERVCFDALNHLLIYARSSACLQSLGVVVGMQYFDTYTRHPVLLTLTKEDLNYWQELGDLEFQQHYRRWELSFMNAPYNAIGRIVEVLSCAPPFDGIAIKVIGEDCDDLEDN